SMLTFTVGDVLEPAPGLKVTVLATGSATGGEFPDLPDGSNINNDSLGFMLEFGGKRILLTGDIEAGADKKLVQRLCEHGDPAHCPALRADVLKVPHHGSAKFDTEFLAATHPAWA